MKRGSTKDPIKNPIYVKCLLPLHLPGPLTYLWPFASEVPEKGKRVLLPLRGRKIIGVLWGLDKAPAKSIEYKPVLKVLDDAPLLTTELMDFIEWAASYYMYPLGMALSEALPSEFVSSKKKSALRIEKEGTMPGRSRLETNEWKEPMIKRLSREQKDAIKVVENACLTQVFNPILLFGVTGSGKTAVYIETVKTCLEAKRGALVMVPEIAMTAQLAGRFKRVFGDDVAILHSGLTPAQRRDQWWKLRQGKSRVALGTRSCIFSPLSNLGLIIVDEEHDSSYKQGERFRYNARDLALLRGQKCGATVVLGSGTPSVSSYFHATSGKYKLVKMESRPGGSRLPDVEIVDRRRKKDAKNHDGDFPWLSPRLKRAIEETLERGEQVLLFLNRRGLATFVFCPECGHVFRCSQCDVTLSWHRQNKAILTHIMDENKKGSGMLTCHYCGNIQSAMPLCPNCGGKTVKSRGFGTEKIADDFLKLFPGRSIARIDRDTLSGRKELERVLAAFKDGQIDCLVGTQMVTKGHDFPNLTLVGVIWADMSLNVPEFNASERTFQLICQVAGRAGRGKRRGLVLIQTYMPEHYSIVCASRHDFLSFYQREITLRQSLSYPPFSRLINIRFSGVKKAHVEKAAEISKKIILKQIGKIDAITVLGPTPCPRGRIKSRYRYQLLLRGELALLRRIMMSVDKQLSNLLPAGVRVEKDVDPINFM